MGTDLERQKRIEAELWALGRELVGLGASRLEALAGGEGMERARARFEREPELRERARLELSVSLMEAPDEQEALRCCEALRALAPDVAREGGFPPALYVAADRGFGRVIQWLLGAGASWEQPIPGSLSSLGTQCAMSFCCAMGSAASVGLAARSGADAMSKNAEGFCPMDAAAKRADAQLIQSAWRAGWEAFCLSGIASGSAGRSKSL